MAEIRDEQELIADGFERVHVELAWIDARYDELTAQLTPHREAPADARRLVAELRSIDGPRYRVDGVDYRVRWGPGR